MDIKIATSAGHPGRANEDFAGAVSDAVVLLDGAGIPGTESICRHGTAWYTHRLGGVLLGKLSRHVGRDLTSILADAIQELAASHRHTCDISSPSSPQATVAITRVAAERLDYLVLADCFIVLGRASGEPLVLTDEREVAARRTCSAPLAGWTRDRRTTSGSGTPVSSSSRRAGISREAIGSRKTIRPRQFAPSREASHSKASAPLPC